jgi:squalene-hopene/tetraprenyl-beta-curcumene cyclase
MNLEVDAERLLLAHKAVRAELLAERASDCHWPGHLASSPLATAAAISALVAAHHRDTDDALRDSISKGEHDIGQIVQGDLSELLLESVNWLARHQNPDGGWGDCEGGRSNIAATVLVQAAVRMTGVPAKFADLMVRGDEYAAAQGGVSGLRRYFARDKTMVAPILANCALAGTIPWRQVPTLPYELACLPQRFGTYFPPPVVRQALPVFVAVGRAKFHHDPPHNPITRLLRRSVQAKSLALLELWQAADDSFAASTPFTAFVVMCLAASGCQEHSVVQRGIEFLLSSVRADASWSITNNLAISNTTMVLNSLIDGSIKESAIGSPGRDQRVARSASHVESRLPQNHWVDTAVAGDTVSENLAQEAESEASTRAASDQFSGADYMVSEPMLDWLLNCQSTTNNQLTDVPPGGWGYSDLPGALPNTNDTAAALRALASCNYRVGELRQTRVERASRLAVKWLLEMQNDDGGWPTFYRDKRPLRFDESGIDATANALRSLVTCGRQSGNSIFSPSGSFNWDASVQPAIENGLKFLEFAQRDDGCFVPQWFGNEFQPDDENPVIGTSLVLTTCAESGRLDSAMARRAAAWLIGAQHASGGWGPPRTPVDAGEYNERFRARRANDALAPFCSVVETAMAIAALWPMTEASLEVSQAVSSGLKWLINALEQDVVRRPAVLGFSLSKIWYHERLLPLALAAGVLSRAVSQLAPQHHAAASLT